MLSRTSLNQPFTRLFLLGIASAVLYGIITWLSQRFHLSIEPAERPLLAALALFGSAFLIYLLACCEVWPTTKKDPANAKEEKNGRLGWFLLSRILGLGILLRCAQQFYFMIAPADRPSWTVLILLLVGFLVYLLVFWGVWTSPRSDSENSKDQENGNSARKSLWMIVGFGILFRVIMVFSIPIQEIDLYRYILDGAVGNANVSPFEFAPMELVRAVEAVKTPESANTLHQKMFARSPEEQKALEGLAQHIASKPGLETCLSHIHYGEYTSPYPPISQAVFRVATGVVPANASERTWVFAMKATLTLFDILTGFLLIGLLRQCGLSDHISLWYWWCPLAIKEIANSGHLDSIVICLTALFAWLAVASIWRRDNQPDRSASLGSLFLALVAATVLGMAVGAKVYPLVFAPVWTICLIRKKGFIGLVPVLHFVVIAAACSWPILQKTSLAENMNLVTLDHDADEALVTDFQTKINHPKVKVMRRPRPGIEMFSRYWEMNDLLFMIVIENVRPYQPKGGTAPWFLVTSESWRTEFATYMVWKYDFEDTNDFAFSYTRIETLLFYVVLTLVFCLLALRANSAIDMLRLFFASVAWFWLLSPTLNPWYWVWALPFLPFSKRPAPWLLLSGMLFMYYLRFYFQNHFPNEFVGPTSYRGQLFFDFVIPWVEFCPVFALLLYQAIFGGKQLPVTDDATGEPASVIG